MGTSDPPRTPRTGCRDPGVISPRSADLTADEEIQALHGRVERRLLESPDPVEIDLNLVRAANSRTVACLISLCRAARRRGVKLEIRPSAEVEAWLALYRLEVLATSGAPRGWRDRGGAMPAA